MNASRKAVAWIISPINVIQCMIAWQKMQTHLNEQIELEVLHYYPSHDTTMTNEIFDVVRNLAKNIDPSIPCHAVSYESGLSTETLKKSLLSEHADYIFMPHDVVGNFFENLGKIYPKAKSICYGDALGQFFQKEVHLSFLYKGKDPLYSLKKIIKRITGNNLSEHTSLPKDYAVLTIPVSQAPLPPETELIIPEKNIARQIIARCTEADHALNNYCQAIVQEIWEHNGNACLFMTENMAEGNFISAEREADMYAEAIEKNCSKGALVYIKPHPGEQYDRISLLNKRLRDRYTIKKFDPYFKRYPIELFHPILEKCTVIAMFYPALSLKYLYNMDVIQPMDNALIDRYFEKQYRESYKNAISLNMIPLHRLPHWDGKGLLYNGR